MPNQGRSSFCSFFAVNDVMQTPRNVTNLVVSLKSHASGVSETEFGLHPAGGGRSFVKVDGQVVNGFRGKISAVRQVFGCGRSRPGARFRANEAASPAVCVMAPGRTRVLFWKSPLTFRVALQLAPLSDRAIFPAVAKLIPETRQEAPADRTSVSGQV
jgi:hypothetical protein